MSSSPYSKDIRRNVEALDVCHWFVQLAQLMEEAVLAGIDQCSVGKAFSLIGKILRNHPVSEKWYREPLTSEVPTTEWVEWFRCCIEAGFDPRSDLVRLLDTCSFVWADYAKALHGLPIQVRERLGPEYDWRQWPHTLCVEINQDDSTQLIHGLLPSPGLAQPCSVRIAKCGAWNKVVEFLGTRRILWPTVDVVQQRILGVLEVFRKAGREDFTATKDEIKPIIERHLEREMPDWLITDQAPEKIKKQLLAGIISEPSFLKIQLVVGEVKAFFDPIETPDLLIQKAIADLCESETVCTIVLTHRPIACGADLVDRYLVLSRLLGKNGKSFLLNHVTGEEEGYWITLTKAGEILGINPGVISRAVAKGEIRSNGMQGRALRAFIPSVIQWYLARNKKEQIETPEAVEAKFRRLPQDS